MRKYDFNTFFENSEKVFTKIDRNEFKSMFRENVNRFKKLCGFSTPAAIMATFGWICFNDCQSMKCEFSHTFLHNDNPVLVILGSGNEDDAPVDLRIDFNFFDRVLGYKRRDMLDAMKLYMQAKSAIANGMFS